MRKRQWCRQAEMTCVCILSVPLPAAQIDRSHQALAAVHNLTRISRANQTEASINICDGVHVQGKVWQHGGVAFFVGGRRKHSVKKNPIK